MNTQRIALSAVVTLVSSLASGGCFYFPRPSEDRPPPSPPPAPAASTSGYDFVGEGDLFQGTLGSVRRFTHEAPTLRMRSSSTGAYIRVDAENTTARWWAMTSLTLSVAGGLSSPTLQPGAHLSITPNRSAVQGALRVSALGCSGPSLDRFTYDRTADRVDIDVLPGSRDGRNRMVFTAVYTHASETQTVQGSFEYDVR